MVQHETMWKPLESRGLRSPEAAEATLSYM